MKEQKHYQFNPDFIFEFIDQKLTVFDAEKSFLYTFNETASYIFKLLKKNEVKEEIVEKIQKRYGITQEVASRDFDALLSSLKTKQILLNNPQTSQNNHRIKKSSKAQPQRPRRKVKQQPKTR